MKFIDLPSRELRLVQTNVYEFKVVVFNRKEIECEFHVALQPDQNSEAILPWFQPYPKKQAIPNYITSRMKGISKFIMNTHNIN